LGQEIAMSLSTTADLDRSTERARRLGIGFLNWAHALDHFVILIYPTVVIELAAVYDRSPSISAAAYPWSRRHSRRP